jgi:putative flippase GtrA
MTLLYIVGATIGYFGNRQWAFTHKGVVLTSGIRYFIAHFFGYLINFILLLMFVDRLGYSHQWVQAVVIIIVAGFLFLAFKYFVFSDVEGRNRDAK